MKNDKKIEGRPKAKSRTYTPGSRHNIYLANLVGLGVRMDRVLKRKIEVYAKANGITIVEAVRVACEKEFCDVVLTSSDFKLIAEQTQEQEERNARKIAL